MELRERIIKETFNLLVSKSYKALTMDEIAQNLGISKRTLYEQFPDKNDLLVNCLRTFLMSHVKHCDKIYSSNENAMIKFLKFMAESIDSMTKIGYERIEELQKYNPTIYSHIFIPLFEYNKKTSINLLKETQKEGYILDTLDFGFFFNMVKENMFLTTLYEYLKANSSYTPEQIATTHIYIIIRGICTIKGIEAMDIFTKPYITAYAKTVKQDNKKRRT